MFHRIQILLVREEKSVATNRVPDIHKQAKASKTEESLRPEFSGRIHGEYYFKHEFQDYEENNSMYIMLSRLECI